jgi:hypothetical protein
VMGNLFLGIALAVFVAEPSMAPDYPPPPIPPAAVPFDWGGIYSGIEGGGVTGKSNQINRLAPQNISPGYSLGGGQAGVTVGWNSHLFLDSGFSGIVWGIEGDVSWVDSGGSALAASPPGDQIGTVEQWSGSLRPRLGYSFAAGTDRYLSSRARQPQLSMFREHSTTPTPAGDGPWAEASNLMLFLSPTSGPQKSSIAGLNTPHNPTFPRIRAQTLISDPMCHWKTIDFFSV